MDTQNNSKGNTQKDIFPPTRPESRLILGIIAVVVIIVIGGIAYAYSRGIFNRFFRPHATSSLPVGYVTIAVPPGKYPSQLPTDLILYPNASPLRGEVTTPPGGTTQVITAFTVNDPAPLAVITYASYLERNFWKKEVTNIQTNTAYLKYSKGPATLELTVTANAQTANPQTSTEVQLNYMPGKVLAIATTTQTTTTQPVVSSNISTAVTTPGYDVSKDPFPGFFKELVPTSGSGAKAFAVKGQYWQNTQQVGGLFTVTQASSASSQSVSLSGIASIYEAQIKAAGWSATDIHSTADQISFSASRPKSVSQTTAGQAVTQVIQNATVTISTLPSGAGITIDVRIQK